MSRRKSAVKRTILPDARYVFNWPGPQWQPRG